MGKNNTLIPLPFGSVFGNYMVIGTRQPGRLKILCRCSCGKVKEVRTCHLTAGRTLSCGHRTAEQKEVLRAANIKHGMKGSATYRSWRSMKTRCYNSNHQGHQYYLERGITVCDRWLHSFENFFADMGERPAGLSLDRIDNDKGYSPENCRWATPAQQTHNRRGKYGRAEN